MKRHSALIIVGLILFFVSCKKDEEPEEEFTVVFDNTPYVLEHPSHFPPPDLPLDNILTQQKVKLGKMLFHETMLSGDNTQACADCHLADYAFNDPNQFSIGIEGLPGNRNAMGVFNLAWNTNGFFWDGRAETLREQSLMPIQDHLEMNETLENVVSKLSASQTYKDQFIRAFGSDQISAEAIGLAMEQFMLTIVSGSSKYDDYLQGTYQLTESEERGRELFFTEYNPFFPEESGADCAHCHSGSNFENDQYMNNGLDTDDMITDQGRMNVTDNPSDRGKFKVTSLRNIELTAPYMHDGRFATLKEVIDHYNEDIQISTTVDVTLSNTEATGLMLSDQDKNDLIAFLKTLTDTDFTQNPEYLE